MNAWLLAALLCVPASAAVVETGVAIAPVAPVSDAIGGAIGGAVGAGASLSPIPIVPDASFLAPKLDLGVVIKAFPGQAATKLPAGAVRFAPAPLPALPAAAAAATAASAPSASGAPSAAPVPQDHVPPSGAAGATALQAVAGRRLATPQDESGMSAEEAAALGRKVFDRAGDRALLAVGSAAGVPGASERAASSPARRDPLLSPFSAGGADGEALRDAVASPIPAAAAPGGAFTFFRVPGSPFSPPRNAAAGAAGAAPVSAPITFERLSLELGEGLVVKVRAAMGFAPAAVVPLLSAGASKGAAPAASSAPLLPRGTITSTEWLERRGLLESLSMSEAAASQEAASLPALMPELAAARSLALAAAPRSAAAPRLLPIPAAPARVPALAWWSLAFLPVVLVLFNEFL